VNQRHALRDRPPVEGGDVPAELYNQWLAQKLMPQPDPAGAGESPDGDPAAGADDDGADVPGEMVAAALEELGVPGGEVRKAQWDENKHKRDHGKFSSTGGGSGGGSDRYPSRHDSSVTYGNRDDRDADDRALGREARRSGRDVSRARAALEAAEKRRAEAEAAAAELRGRLAAADEKVAAARGRAAHPSPAKPSPRAAQVARRAKSSPAVKDQLARAHEWADRMAERHADRVAEHLGIDRASARHVLASTIKMLCERALRGEGDDQSKTFAGAGGQKLTIGVKKKQFAGGPPRPENPQAEGSLAPRKAMSALTDSAGGALVRPPQQGRRMRRRKGVRAVVARVLKSLESGE
jgi:hypothetical protein